MERINKKCFAVLSGDVKELQDEFKTFGLFYQSAYGDENCSLEHGFIVWSTEYSFEQFRQIMLGLCELYRKKSIYIVREIDGLHEVTLWETDSLENIEYKESRQFSKLNFKDVLNYFGVIKLGKMVEIINAASSHCFICCYVRYAQIKQLEERLNKGRKI